MVQNKKSNDASRQAKAFREAARELGCGDNSSNDFDQALKKIASAPPPKSVKKRKGKKPTK